MEIQLVTFDRTFLDLSWDWLSDDETKFLTDAKTITKQEQLEWFKNLNSRTDYRIWGVSAEGKPIGVAGFKNINNKTAYTFWYIGVKQLWGKKIGLSIASAMTKKAVEIGLTTIFGEILLENFRSLGHVFKEGYRIIELNKEKGFYTIKKTL